MRRHCSSNFLSAASKMSPHHLHRPCAPHHNFYEHPSMMPIVVETPTQLPGWDLKKTFYPGAFIASTLLQLSDHPTTGYMVRCGKNHARPKLRRSRLSPPTSYCLCAAVVERGATRTSVAKSLWAPPRLIFHSNLYTTI